MAYERLTEIINDPKTPDTIFDHVANGGSLIDLCEVWQVPYHLVARWLYADEIRKKMYMSALDARIEWMIQRLIGELKSLAFVNGKAILDDNNKLIPLHKWPVEAQRALASFECDERGLTKVKLYDKLKSIELLGKDLGRFVQKHEVSSKLTLEDIVAGSRKDESVPRNSDQRSQG